MWTFLKFYLLWIVFLFLQSPSLLNIRKLDSILLVIQERSIDQAIFWKNKTVKAANTLKILPYSLWIFLRKKWILFSSTQFLIKWKVILESHFLREHTLSSYNSIEGYKVFVDAYLPGRYSTREKPKQNKINRTVISEREFKDPIDKALQIPLSLFLFKMPTICADSALKSQPGKHWHNSL